MNDAGSSVLMSDRKRVNGRNIDCRTHCIDVDFDDGDERPPGR